MGKISAPQVLHSPKFRTTTPEQNKSFYINQRILKWVNINLGKASKTRFQHSKQYYTKKIQHCNISSKFVEIHMYLKVCYFSFSN